MVMVAMTKQRKECALYIKTLKLYIAVLALFLVYFVSTVLYLYVHKIFAFLRMINFCGNIFVYYVLIEKFRDEVNTCVQKFQRFL